MLFLLDEGLGCVGVAEILAISEAGRVVPRGGVDNRALNYAFRADGSIAHQRTGHCKLRFAAYPAAVNYQSIGSMRESIRILTA
jgi:hypothetical protein